MNVLLLFFLVPYTTAYPTWLKSLLPVSGTSIEAEFSCYGLPYGGMGFLSHALTYWTYLCLVLSVSPWRPWKELEHWKADLTLGVISISGTMPTSIITIVRCSRSWPFVLLASWKMLLSLTMGFSAVHRATLVRRKAIKWKRSGFRSLLRPSSSTEEEERSYPSSAPRLWVMLYAVAVIIGLTGLVAFIAEAWSSNVSAAMIAITGIFGEAALISPIIIFVIVSLQHDLPTGLTYGVSAVIIFLGFLAAFYSDWMLAAVAVQVNNVSWAGYPSDDNAVLFWTYFLFKRLPFFSF